MLNVPYEYTDGSIGDSSKGNANQVPRFFFSLFIENAEGNVYMANDENY